MAYLQSHAADRPKCNGSHRHSRYSPHAWGFENDMAGHHPAKISVKWQPLPGTVMQHLGQEFSHAPLTFTQRPLASCSRRPIGPLQPVRPCRQTTQPRRSMSLEEAQTAPAHKAPLSRVQHDPQGQCSAGNQTSPSLRLSTMPDPEAPTYVVSSPPSAPMAPATTKRDIPAF